MFVGKWNKSVILTYVGLMASISGIFFAITAPEKLKIAFTMLVIAGICDLFDGFVARKCKRTEEEKAFGIELDSLVDAVSFLAFPIVLMVSMGLTQWYHLIAYMVYTICGIARLAYFNVVQESTSEPVKYYLGLPVTYVALIYSVLYSLQIVVSMEILQVLFLIATLVISLLFILKVKIKKPRGIWYLFFSLLSILMIVIYVVVL